MEKVIDSDHARASIGSRAAKTVRASALSPASTARSVIKMADHHSAGTLSRCHHFETAEALAPMSAAIASREGQRSMMDWNDDKSVMPNPIRPIVLNCKDKLSEDVGISSGHTVLMSGISAKAFKDQFTARVAFARHKAGYTQSTMAGALGFGPADDPSGQSKYHKYERRSMMPHHLIPRFCSLCEITMAWLYTGPVVARPIEKRGRKPKLAPVRGKREVA